MPPPRPPSGRIVTSLTRDQAKQLHKQASGLPHVTWKYANTPHRRCQRPLQIDIPVPVPRQPAAIGKHARNRIRQLTKRRRLWVPDEWVVQDLNQFLRGWGGYFRYGNFARV